MTIIQLTPEELKALIIEVLRIELSRQNLLVNSQSTKTILGVKELAEKYGWAEATIYSWTSKRKIPFYKIGENGKIYFKEEEVIKWIESGRVKPLKELSEVADDFFS